LCGNADYDDDRLVRYVEIDEVCDESW